MNSKANPADRTEEEKTCHSDVVVVVIKCSLRKTAILNSNKIEELNILEMTDTHKVKMTYNLKSLKGHFKCKY